MKSADAKRALDACRAKATEIGKPVSICILDGAGLMVMFERFNDPPPQTAIVAEGKAAGAALTGRPSAALQQIADNRPMMAHALAARLGGRFVPLQGAVPLNYANGTVGAIGVSGATSEEDETIAKAGAAALGM